MKQKLLFLAILAMVSCSVDSDLIPTTDPEMGNSESVDFEKSNQAINFNDENIWGEGEVKTRATLVDDENLLKFYVWAQYRAKGATKPLAFNLMNAQYVSRADAASSWTYTPKQFWPADPADLIDFYALSPTTLTQSIVDNKFTVDYTLPSDIANQKDILIAIAKGKSRNDNTVHLAFKHALSYITFEVTNDGSHALQGATIGSVTIDNCYNTGFLSQDDAENVVWNFDGKTVGNINWNVGTGSATKSFFFIPQNLNGALTTVTCKKGTYEFAPYAYDAGLGIIEPGKKYTKTIKQILSEINFDFYTSDIATNVTHIEEDLRKLLTEYHIYDFPVAGTYKNGYLGNGTAGTNPFVQGSNGETNKIKIDFSRCTNALTSIPANSFKGATNIEAFTGLNHVTSIGDSAFENCSSITSLLFPNVNTIGDSAFKNCSGITHLEFPKVTSETKIGNNAFTNVPNLKYLKLGVSHMSTQSTRDKFNVSNLEVLDLPNAKVLQAKMFSDGGDTSPNPRWANLRTIKLTTSSDITRRAWNVGDASGYPINENTFYGLTTSKVVLFLHKNSRVTGGRLYDGLRVQNKTLAKVFNTGTVNKTKNVYFKAIYFIDNTNQDYSQGHISYWNGSSFVTVDYDEYKDYL